MKGVIEVSGTVIAGYVKGQALLYKGIEWQNEDQTRTRMDKLLNKIITSINIILVANWVSTSLVSLSSTEYSKNICCLFIEIFEYQFAGASPLLFISGSKSVAPC